MQYVSTDVLVETNSIRLIIPNVPEGHALGKSQI